MDDNARRIESAVLVTLPMDQAVDEVQVAALVEQLRKVFPIGDAERDGLLHRLHTRLAIKMDTGIALVETDHHPWLNARKPKIDPFYWDRYQKYLFSMGWVPSVVTTLDTVTDELLDLCGDPERGVASRRRGLVVGDVQSGKTATYTAVCCKAADAGYRLIILLTGTLESLRRQTQERLDAGFVGLDSSGFLSTQRRNRALGVGVIDQTRTGVVFTSRIKDFSTSLVNQLNFRLNAFQEPILLVVKKNKRILENLENWLRDYNARNGRIELPLLLIDDEADNASVNTSASGDDPTQINQRIRALLSLFTSSTYLGFTATPFANVFIDPDNESDMLGNDLFPRDFIYALEAPTNYLGPARTFGIDGNGPSVLRDIDDADAYFPHDHKVTFQVSGLPESLLEALRSFVVANAIRDLRGADKTHRSMLVNVSRFTDVQMQVAKLVEAELRTMQNDIRNYSKLEPQEALKNGTIAVLQATWEREFKDAGHPWEAVQRALLDAALPIVIRAVNQRTGAAALDYAAHRQDGLRVVAVGGNSLSRGLTLEGLMTSYFLRNSQMYDTLLQMGRWFGYRDGYADVCRVWLSREAQHWYAHITAATDELRAEFRRMRKLSLTPKEFGLKVRAHPDSLIVTARNKMRLAKTVVREISMSEQGPETPRLWKQKETIAANAHAVRDFIRGIERAGCVRTASPFSAGTDDASTRVWKGAARSEVAGLLRRFRVHPNNFTFQSDELAAFLDGTDEPCLQEWDVVLPSGSAGIASVLSDLAVRAQRRVVTVGNAGDILVSGKSARVGSRGVEREGIDPEKVRSAEEEYRKKEGKENVPDRLYRAIRQRPLLLLHCIAPVYTDETPMDAGGEPVFALGLSFPRFDDSGVARRVVYRVNVVEWRSLFESEADDEQDQDDEVT
jgi:hypothetical protein